MTRHPLPEFYNDLDATLVHAWAQLARGVADRRSALHAPTLATVGPDGAPMARTVILRACDAPARIIRIHTDRRSAKVAELQADDRATLHAYDAGQKLQLRLAGRVTLHSRDAIATEAWARSKPMSRALYGQALAPGTRCLDPHVIPPGSVPDGELTGFENLLIIRLSIASLECLYLGAQGHRRARFSWPDGKLDATWLAP